MGLDMYAYSRAKDKESKANELQYWRKHNALHGLLEDMWNDKGQPIPQWMRDEYPEDFEQERVIPFNGIEMELTEADINYIESAVMANELPETEGFFFGGDSRFDEHNKAGDLEFIKKAREALARGEEVFYTSSW
jgi:hypothetical protein